MYRQIKAIIVLILIVLTCNKSYGQDSSRLDRAISFPDRFFGALDKKTSSIEGRLDRQTEKYLDKLERTENKLRKKIARKDSALAKQLFDGVDEKYNALRNMSGNISKYQSVYSGHLDSLSTALGFLKNQDITNNPELEKALVRYKELQGKLNASDQVRRQLEFRGQALKEQFQKIGMVRQLKQYRKEVYYYQQQVWEYKQAFEDPSKLEKKLMEVMMRIPQFKNFFSKNSLLGSMFALPSDNANPSISIAGLQTRAMFNQNLVTRFGSTTRFTQQLQQATQGGRGGSNILRDKLSSFSNGSYGNTSGSDIPGFKPNTQKTKSFFQRLEYGANIQTKKARYFFPVTSDIAFSLGYKINDKSSIGVGASYKLGFGNNWNNIRLSHQGVGLRSYLDWKLKGSLYMSGGYEQNYSSMIKSMDQLHSHSAWQNSGLIGLSKKYSIRKNMKGDMKFLWDFMSYRQVPKGQPILFRVGYSF